MACFFCVLPVSNSVLPSLQRILVVEHAEDLVTLFLGVLHAHFDCQTVAAGSFAEAVEHLEDQNFDFVLSDLVLPGPSGSGLDLAEWLREHQPALSKRFIIVTATSGSDELAAARQRGVVQVLFKPFNATQLTQAIEQTLQAATLTASLFMNAQ